MKIYAISVWVSENVSVATIAKVEALIAFILQ